MTLNDLYHKQFNNIDNQVNLFNQEMQSVFDKVQTLAISRLKGLSESDVLAYDLEWNKILNEAGYYELVNKYLSHSFDSIYDDVIKGFEIGGLSVAFTQSDVAKIDALKAMDKQFFDQLGIEAGISIKRQLYGYVVGGQSAKDIALNIKTDLANTNLDKYAYTYAQTSITNFQQSVTDIKSENTESVWIYDGVLDNKTRPYCRCILNANRYYTLSEKLKVQNDPAREWNCRHHLYSVSEQFAIDNGYEAGPKPQCSN